jgi:hypothetical protein
MRRCLVLALIAGGLAGPATAEAEFQGAFTWIYDDWTFGGFSGLETDGDRFHALTDGGTMYRGRFLREDGRIVGIKHGNRRRLTDAAGDRLDGHENDAEGIAIGPDGRVFLSFEYRHRVVEWTANASPELPVPRDFLALQTNSGLEALAIDAEGRLYAVPERSGKLDRPFPVYRYTATSGSWDVAFRLERSGSFLPTGADFGPDGRLFLLERDFHGIFGFSSRVRVFDPVEGAVLTGETLIETRPGVRDNLEGISVWVNDAGETILTMISDDNFFPIQRTEIVEYRLLP